MHIEGLSIKPVENGHIVCYTEFSKAEGAGEFEPMMMNRKEFVYQDKDIKQAFKKYEELVPMMKNKDKGEYKE